MVGWPAYPGGQLIYGLAYISPVNSPSRWCDLVQPFRASGELKRAEVHTFVVIGSILDSLLSETTCIYISVFVDDARYISSDHAAAREETAETAPITTSVASV